MKYLFAFCITTAGLWGQSLNCDMSRYKAMDGLTAQTASGGIQLNWRGQRNQQLSATFPLRGGQQLIQELSVRKNGGGRIVLGKDLAPEFEVTSGVRRLSEQQAQPLRALKIEITPAVIE